MTAQVPEALLFKGERLELCSEPLAQFFSQSGNESPFMGTSTACWRGYVGTWELDAERLYLVDLASGDTDHTFSVLPLIFPEASERIFADWVSGKLRVPQGKLLEYVHGGYGSTYESDLILTVEKGVLQSTEVRANELPKRESAPQGAFANWVASFAWMASRRR